MGRKERRMILVYIAMIICTILLILFVGSILAICVAATILDVIVGEDHGNNHR